MGKRELYPGQAGIVEGKVREQELLQQADEERLKQATDPAERETILRRLASRTGAISTQRRYLDALLSGEEGEEAPACRTRIVRMRLTPDEYGRLVQAAEAAGQTLSEYLRVMAGI